MTRAPHLAAARLRTYGSLGAVAILLIWLYVSAYIILAGAELNDEIGRDDEDPPPHEDR